ncbi:PadR family transcriptional regulator [Alteromonas ponticola]|uniref:PadR family transcriptional regulator n=1 Tax=Alteromonas aquimaris TaxID=2998417 RepID=A0ABT3P725_9ALTE|nr:PadR family transcriptional regulator [Alteromonas aquimaris]MCW8108330.1 PadR family transcriptional regulator [Alteromonas aquimaris]
MANKQTFLGEFEHIVMLTVLSLGDDAYGVTVRQQLRDIIGREVAIGALYATTERLEKKGLLTSTKSGASAQRGGKAKRYFKVTSQGIAELERTKQNLEKLWGLQAVSQTI